MIDAVERNAVIFGGRAVIEDETPDQGKKEQLRCEEETTDLCVIEYRGRGVVNNRRGRARGRLGLESGDRGFQFHQGLRPSHVVLHFHPFSLVQILVDREEVANPVQDGLGDVGNVGG